MKVSIGEREMDYPSDQLGQLNEATDLWQAGDVSGLRRRMADDGYLLIRGLQDRDTVLNARRAVVEYMAERHQFAPGTDPMDMVIDPSADRKDVQLMGNREISHEPRVRALLESEAIFGFFERYFDEPARTFDYKWMRGVTTGQSTGSHYDVVYMGRGTVDQLFTVWTPLGDVPIESGPLTICGGSHNLDSFAKVRATYGGSDVDRDLISGWFSEDPMELVEKFGGRWLTSGFEAGDVLIFTMFTMHSSVSNATDRFRLSTDTRFQPASAPVDERWVGENPIAHYRWKEGEGDTGPFMTSMKDARAKWDL